MHAWECAPAHPQPPPELVVPLTRVLKRWLYTSRASSRDARGRSTAMQMRGEGGDTPRAVTSALQQGEGEEEEHRHGHRYFAGHGQGEPQAGCSRAEVDRRESRLPPPPTHTRATTVSWSRPTTRPRTRRGGRDTPGQTLPMTGRATASWMPGSTGEKAGHVQVHTPGVTRYLSSSTRELSRRVVSATETRARSAGPNPAPSPTWGGVPKGGRGCEERREGRGTANRRAREMGHGRAGGLCIHCHTRSAHNEPPVVSTACVSGRTAACVHLRSSDPARARGPPRTARSATTARTGDRGPSVGPVTPIPSSSPRAPVPC
jgi:hypothetical protein